MPKFKDLKKFNIVKSSNGNYIKVKDEEEKMTLKMRFLIKN